MQRNKYVLSQNTICFQPWTAGSVGKSTMKNYLKDTIPELNTNKMPPESQEWFITITPKLIDSCFITCILGNTSTWANAD